MQETVKDLQVYVCIDLGSRHAVHASTEFIGQRPKFSSGNVQQWAGPVCMVLLLSHVKYFSNFGITCVTTYSKT